MVALTELLGLNVSMDSRDRALMVVAGLCHDIGHPGRNNALFINALDPVAILYNDKSVLENYHSCLTFKTLELPDCDIFMSLRTKVGQDTGQTGSLFVRSMVLPLWIQKGTYVPYGRLVCVVARGSEGERAVLVQIPPPPPRVD